jgi:hypothetical protein
MRSPARFATLISGRAVGRAALGLVFGLAAGCDGAAVDDVADASDAHTQGVVIIERVTTQDGSTQTHVSAKFMRLLGGAEQEAAERLVGSRLDLPALGECRAARPSDDAPLSTQGSIELMDVGNVTMSSDALSLPLSVRAFPDIADFVSGVFYTSRDATTELPAPARYRIENTGSGAMDRFNIELDAPTAPEDVRLANEPLGSDIILPTTAPIALAWRPGQAQDVIYVDLTSARNPNGVRCAFSDVGAGVIPAELIREGIGESANLSVAVHRVRLAGLSVPGIDQGEARFDLAVIGQATIASTNAGP